MKRGVEEIEQSLNKHRRTWKLHLCINPQNKVVLYEGSKLNANHMRLGCPHMHEVLTRDNFQSVSARLTRLGIIQDGQMCVRKQRNDIHQTHTKHLPRHRLSDSPHPSADPGSKRPVPNGSPVHTIMTLRQAASNKRLKVDFESAQLLNSLVSDEEDKGELRPLSFQEHREFISFGQDEPMFDNLEYQFQARSRHEVELSNHGTLLHSGSRINPRASDRPRPAQTPFDASVVQTLDQ